MKIVFATILTLASAGVVHADRVSPPAVPEIISVGAGDKLFFWGHAVGTQNYICTLTPAGTIEWFFTGPQATIYDADLEQTMTHSLSRNPEQSDLGFVGVTVDRIFWHVEFAATAAHQRVR